MAFTTVQGATASDATSIIGTLGRDVLVLNSAVTTYVGAQAEIDAITTNGASSSTTIKGGQGNDSIIQDISGTFTDSLVNGNKGADTISIHSANNTKIYGGQGTDLITANNITNGTKVNGNKGVDSVYVTNADTSSVYGGAGEDTLVLKGSLLKTTIDGNKEADTITLDATSNLNLTSVYGGTGGDTITVNTTAGFTNSTILGGEGTDTINATNATSAIAANGEAGADTITGGSGADTLTGGEGADSITAAGGADTVVLTETTAASDIVVTGATAAANGSDIITGYKTGALNAGGDVLKIDAFLDATTMNAEITENPDAVDVEDDVNLLVDIADGQDITTAAGLNTALAADGEYANINMAADKKAVFVTASSATSTTLHVFFATSDDDQAITAVKVGTITTTAGDIGTLVGANFNI